MKANASSLKMSKSVVGYSLKHRKNLNKFSISCIYYSFKYSVDALHCKLKSFTCSKDVIEKADTLAVDEMGAPLWRLALCLLLSWIVVVCCLIKGVKSSGKVSVQI
jgi:hypothetical protein